MFLFYHPLISLCYGLLYLSVILVWFPGKGRFPRWAYTFVAAVLIGLMSKQLQLSVLTSMILMGLSAYYCQQYTIKPSRRLLATVVAFLTGAVLMTHQIPGYNNLLALDHISLSADAMPYTLYLNFDKALVGIFILGFGPALLGNGKQLIQLVKKIKKKIGLLILVLMFLSLVFGFVRFSPKLPVCLPLWMLTNLLFGCVAECAFFFAFVQRKLALVMKENHLGNYTALILSATLFALAHHAGGNKYMLLALVAGLGYAWLYQLTKRVEASILAQFAVNLTQFLFFTYPTLASVT